MGSSAWHFPSPAQRILNLDVETARGMPTEFALRLPDVADQSRRVSRPTKTYLMRHLSACYPGRLGDDLAHTMTRSTTQVESLV